MSDSEEDKVIKAANVMLIYGGHFANSIGRAILYADSSNRERLVQAFPDLIQKYYDMGKTAP